MRQSVQSDLAAAGLTLLGKRLGSYQIAQLIGVGGMGEVYRGERADGEFRQTVAIKVVRGATDPSSIARFRAERQMLATLTHPNIARMYDGGTTESGEPYLVMEYIQGQRIDEYAKSRNLTATECLRLFQTVCEAVQYAHQHNIIHRDIKPANIMVGDDGAPRLLDFGIAKLLEVPGAELTATATHARALTPEYASPEQLMNHPLTPASDVFSLGAILHELLSGVRFRSPSAKAREGGRKIAPGLARIIARATASDPADRYASAAELSQAISRALTSAPRRAWFVALAAAALLVVIAGAFLWRSRAGSTSGGGSIAVIEIENLSQDASLDWMDRGVSELLTTGLAQSARFEVISTERVRDLMARRVKGDGKFPAAMVSEVASAAHAAVFRERRPDARGTVTVWMSGCRTRLPAACCSRTTWMATTRSRSSRWRMKRRTWWPAGSAANRLRSPLRVRPSPPTWEP